MNGRGRQAVETEQGDAEGKFTVETLFSRHGKTIVPRFVHHLEDRTVREEPERAAGKDMQDLIDRATGKTDPEDVRWLYGSSSTQRLAEEVASSRVAHQAATFQRATASPQAPPALTISPSCHRRG